MLIYAAAMAAISEENYKNLATVLLTDVRTRSESNPVPVIIPTVRGLLEVQRTDAFKKLAGYEKFYTPRSEYMLTTLQPTIDDLLFLGRNYENLFDRVEVFVALVHADATYETQKRIWGPPGRFAWKYRREAGNNPFLQICGEADQAEAAWGPLQAGLFQGSYERFKEIAAGYANLMKELNWW